MLSKTVSFFFLKLSLTINFNPTVIIYLNQNYAVFNKLRRSVSAFTHVSERYLLLSKSNQLSLQSEVKSMDDN